MNDDDVTVLCGANSYERKYYFNSQFDMIPERVQEELRLICLDFTESIGGIFVMVFTEDGRLSLMVSTAKGDYDFDEIGCELKIKKIQEENEELMNSMELYYQAFIQGVDVETLKNK